MGEKEPGCKSGIFSVPSTRRMVRVRGVRDDDLIEGWAVSMCRLMRWGRVFLILNTY